jgi:DNA repair ATPase RecN
VKVQEGDEPVESAEELIAQYERSMTELEKLIVRINDTNNRTAFDGATLAKALAKRECLTTKIKTYRDIYDEGSILQDRYSRQEVKYIRCLELKDIQSSIDSLSKEYRELDTAIQAMNWTTELL